MKIRITKVDIEYNDGRLTLEQCGFKVGDVVEVDDSFKDGLLSVLAIRNTDEIKVGDSIGVEQGEYEVVEE